MHAMIAAQHPFPEHCNPHHVQAPSGIVMIEELVTLVNRASQYSEQLFKPTRAWLAQAMQVDVFKLIYDDIAEVPFLFPQMVLEFYLVNEMAIIRAWNEMGLKSVSEADPHRIFHVSEDNDEYFPLRAVAKYAGVAFTTLTTPLPKYSFNSGWLPGFGSYKNSMLALDFPVNASEQDRRDPDDDGGHEGGGDEPKPEGDDNGDAFQPEQNGDKPEEDHDESQQKGDDGKHQTGQDNGETQLEEDDDQTKVGDDDDETHLGDGDNHKPQPGSASTTPRKGQHHFIRDAPSMNLPMPTPKKDQEVNMTIVELMTFFPQCLRAPMVINRLAWNGGKKSAMAHMIKAHRINETKNLDNAILKSIQGEMGPLLGISPTAWKLGNHAKLLQEHNEPLYKQCVDDFEFDSINMASYKTPLEANPGKPRRTNSVKTIGTGPIPFIRLGFNIRHLPVGHDALDLTRCVKYVLDHPNDCRAYMFPTDYFKVLSKVGGPKPVADDNRDRACFLRYSRTMFGRAQGKDPVWEQGCANHLAVYATQTGTLIPARYTPSAMTQAPTQPQIIVFAQTTAPTHAPAASQAPAATQAPSLTKGPAATNSPAATNGLAATNGPAATKQPATTHARAATQALAAPQASDTAQNLFNVQGSARPNPVGHDFTQVRPLLSYRGYPLAQQQFGELTTNQTTNNFFFQPAGPHAHFYGGNIYQQGNSPPPYTRSSSPSGSDDEDTTKNYTYQDPSLAYNVVPYGNPMLGARNPMWNRINNDPSYPGPVNGYVPVPTQQTNPLDTQRQQVNPEQKGKRKNDPNDGQPARYSRYREGSPDGPSC